MAEHPLMPALAPFVDTHCHIDTSLERDSVGWPEFKERIDACAPEFFIHVACHPDDLDWGLRFLDQEPRAYGAMGIHPQEASLYTPAVEEHLKFAMKHPKVLALGEIGLDYHYDTSPREVQRTVFSAQLGLALALSKPVVLHTREADGDTLAILKEYDQEGLRLHVHCYTGSPEFALELLALKATCYFGFTGVLTFKNGENVRASARVVPQGRLLLETDAPYLAPVPWRGQTGHPGMIPAIGAALAQCRGEDPLELALACRANTRAFYGI